MADYAMKKNFVLDTNVLLHNPEAVFRFEDNHIIIPIFVIEEIDTFKRDMTELGRNAREFTRLLDRLREKGPLGQGVELDNGGTLRVSFQTQADEHDFLTSEIKDNLILGVALFERDHAPQVPCIFVTKDVNLRVRADALGLRSENFEDEISITPSEVYTGHIELSVGQDVIKALHDTTAPEGPLLYADEVELMSDGQPWHRGTTLFYENQYVLLRSEDGQSSFAKLSQTEDNGQKARLRFITQRYENVWGIKPRNIEQHFALDALLDDSVNLVTLVGKAGTGKTLLAIAAGLRKVTDEQKQHKLLVARPVIPMGRDIGFLPGTMEEKLGPWMRPIFDNVEYLMGLTPADKRAGRGANELIDMGVIEIEALTYIRGRSLPNQYIIIDEAQNLTSHEAKTILTRVGENTKIIMTGDPYQIDNPYVDIRSNGLTYVLERFKGQSVAATITLTKGERSALAELAANIL